MGRGEGIIVMQALQDLDLSRWVVYAVPVVGFLCGGLTLLVGRMLLRKPHRRPPPRQSVTSQPDPFEDGSNTERRTYLRRPGRPVDILLSDESGQAKPIMGWIIDRSMGGLCLAVKQAVPEFAIRSVRTVDAPSSAPWVQIEIRRCEKKDDYWELGCKFVRTPAYGVLLYFG
jgi:hypothetical protein